jgi:MraZ protein
VFLGTHAPRLDEKGRLFLPAKYREELAGGVVITKGQERCLFVFPQEEFARITEALRNVPVTAKSVRDSSRVFFASASDEVPDKQGRITVPAALRAYAGLQRDCVVIGANTRLEIWDTQAWETYLAAQEDSFAEAAEASLPRCQPAPADGNRPTDAKRHRPGNPEKPEKSSNPQEHPRPHGREGRVDKAQHVPVLAGRVTALLAPALAADGAVLVDATLGRAGHARALLEASTPTSTRSRRPGNCLPRSRIGSRSCTPGTTRSRPS